MSIFWKNIYEQEKSRLQNGQLHRGDKFATASELARDYGVNYLTARRVQKELAAAGFLTKSPTGDFLVAGVGQQAKIYFLAPGSAFTQYNTSSSWMLMQQGVFEEALRLKQQIVPISFDECLKLPEEPAVLLFIGGSTRFADEVFFKLLPPWIYPVTINAWEPPSRGTTLGSDNKKMMYDLTHSFVEQGFHRIGYAGDTGGRMYERFDGYYQAITAGGIQFVPQLAYTLWQVNYKNIMELAAWIEQEKLEAICTPSIDVIDFIEQHLPPHIFEQVAWGSIGKPNAIVPAYRYVQPDYIGQGNLAVKLALEVDPLAEASPHYHALPAQLHLV